MMNPYRRLLIAVSAAYLLAAAGVMAFIVIADPYWLISKRTLRADSPVLDTQMRTAKALQLVFREKEVPLKVILLGSSTVYRGLNPSVLDYAPGEVYNLGISSLRMLEA